MIRSLDSSLSMKDGRYAILKVLGGLGGDIHGLIRLVKMNFYSKINMCELFCSEIFEYLDLPCLVNRISGKPVHSSSAYKRFRL